MKASELRIGNYIISDRAYFDKPEIGKIYQISESTCFFEYFESNVNELRCISNPAQYLKPIPLNEEWLIKFGFVSHQVRSDRVYYKAPASDYSLEKKPEWDHFEFTTPDIGVHIKYVHQLQNIFFALTGEELTIKEEKQLL